LRPRQKVIYNTLDYTILTELNSQGCNDFLAGNMIRSTTRNKLLDETALFDCVCRHDCPIMLFNMDKGRRNVIVVLPIFYRRLSYALVLMRLGSEFSISIDEIGF
jgi:hypothetical protein